MSLEEDLCGTSGMQRHNTTREEQRRPQQNGRVLKEERVKVGFEISNSKTNVIKIHGERGFTIQGEKKTEVEIFIFLGSGVTCNGDSTTEIETD